MLSVSSVFLLVGAFCILTGVPVFICAKRLDAESSKFSVERSKIELNNSTYLEQFDKEHEHLLFKKVNTEKLLLLGMFLLVLGICCFMFYMVTFDRNKLKKDNKLEESPKDNNSTDENIFKVFNQILINFFNNLTQKIENFTPTQFGFVFSASQAVLYFVVSFVSFLEQETMPDALFAMFYFFGACLSSVLAISSYKLLQTINN